MGRFHLSLDVTDVERSVGFSRLLLGCEPVKVKGDYAKFEPREPAVVLSLETREAVGPNDRMTKRRSPAFARGAPG